MDNKIKTLINEEMEKNILDLYKKLKNIKIEQLKLKKINKETEEEISKDLAELLNYRKKDNTIDTGRIKKAILKEAILSVINDEISKIEEKYNFLQEYKTKIEKEENLTNENMDNYINIELIKKYINELSFIEEIKENEKEIKGEYQDKLDKNMIKIIDKFVREEIKEENSNNKENKEIEKQFENYILKIIKNNETKGKNE